MTTRSTLATLLIALSVLPKITLATEYYNKQLCSDQKQYTCIKIKKGDTWEKLFPDPQKQDIVKKINRMNIRLSPGMTIAIPNNLDQNPDQLLFAPFPTRIATSGRTVIIVDLTTKAFAAYNIFGLLVHWGPVSGGRGWCPDTGSGCNTPLGVHYVQSKGGAGCISSKFPIPDGGAPMAYCMYFHGGYALHASELPGYNASHGCVRLFREDAEWLNKNFVDTNAKTATEVIVRK